ncbi:MAG: valine--tRNA ligase [marine bacterium B5-7]|nr:MAG: valine--tRNA ligase [marine bacterium B5-7]
MEKSYTPKDIEQRWYNTWETNGYFKSSGEGQPYCIVIPPPNVTGTLHVGHGFQQTLMDVMTRYHRMCGDNTLWQTGTDHAGISTQMVVERQLAQDGISRHDLGRETFLDKVWAWKKQSGNIISEQMRRVGNSTDWDRERFSMDEGLSNAVKTAFIKLHEDGLIYRGKKLVNWDPKFETAISDLEVITEEENSSIWHIRYPIKDTDQFITIATTRPETLFGDTAIAVNPNDERYKALIGKYATIPVVNRDIPIIADDYADPEFGTGCVKITPAHDFNDYEVGQRHDLPMINVFTPDAKINKNAPEAFQGLDRFDARKQLVDALEAQKFLVAIEEHKHPVPRGDRSGVPIEPYLTDQWFVKADALAKPAIDAVKKGDVRFIPENWSKTYYQWLENIQDWCISRQLWWGHRIPAWYDAEGNFYVGHDEADVRQKNKLDDSVVLTQDDDVLDTWFSASLWPFSTLGWPEKTPELKQFYPTAVLMTGFDIIFFWVARMVMMGLYFIGDVPFRDVYITGLIRDKEGQKMSKTKGNVLDPIDLVDGIDLESLVSKRTKAMMQPQMAKKIEKQTRDEFPDGIQASGMDALRFTFCALATTGRDIRLDLNRLAGYRNFCNKLWNATRYVLMSTEDVSFDNKPYELSLFDQWILSRLQHCTQQLRTQIDAYRFDLAAKTLYEFVWYEFCDWYLEFSKHTQSEIGTKHTLLNVLENILRLLHPLMPFITEELWQTVKQPLGITGDTIMQQAFPVADDALLQPEVEANVTWLQQVITGVRNIRGEMNIAPAKPLTVLLHQGNETDHQRAETLGPMLTQLAKLDSLTWHTEGELPPAATALVDELEVLIPLAGIIDKQQEVTRLQKEIQKVEKDLTKTQQKLANPNFADKAPAEVVALEKSRLADMQTTLHTLQQRVKMIESL